MDRKVEPSQFLQDICVTWSHLKIIFQSLAMQETFEFFASSACCSSYNSYYAYKLLKGALPQTAAAAPVVLP